MLALVLSLILALYILGPDVVSRLVVSLFAPGRPRPRNRGEEIARALIVSAIPISIAYCVSHFWFGRFTHAEVLADFLLGLYGEKSLEEHSAQFFNAAGAVIRVNVELLLIPVYAMVVAWSVVLGLLIRNYGKLLRKYEHSSRKSAALTWLVRPWVAEWHLKLSGVLLPRKDDYLRADVLTKGDLLYRGTLTEHHLGPDGILVSITLAAPQKFKRKELVEAREDASKGPNKRAPNPSLFWSPIDAQIFIIMASEIVTLNLNYVDPASLKKKAARVSRTGAGNALAVAASRKRSNSPGTSSAIPARQRPQRGGQQPSPP